MGRHREKTIAVDFDGVIHAYRMGWAGGLIYDEPVTGARLAIRRLREEGFEVVIHTTRDPAQVHDWLKAWSIPVHKVTNLKPTAIAYIDDRAIRFTNWPDVLKYFA